MILPLGVAHPRTKLGTSVLAQGVFQARPEGTRSREKTNCEYSWPSDIVELAYNESDDRKEGSSAGVLAVNPEKEAEASPLVMIVKGKSRQVKF